MPRDKVTQVFKYDELDEKAKEKAREWYTRDSYPYDEWWDCTFDDFQTICEIIGIDLTTKPVRLMGGGTRNVPQIQFSGFWSQGDGASYEGRYTYCCTAFDKIREHAPEDTELHRIVDDLHRHASEYPSQVTINIGHRGRYSHSGCMTFDGSVEEVWSEEEEGYVEPELSNLEDFAQSLRELADWLYQQLEKTYEWYMSDEVVAENIIANEYEFDKYGNPE